MLKMGDQISFGGTRFDGKREKIPEFAMKAAATGNLALTEINGPEEPLFDKTASRGAV